VVRRGIIPEFCRFVYSGVRRCVVGLRDGALACLQMAGEHAKKNDKPGLSFFI